MIYIYIYTCVSLSLSLSMYISLSLYIHRAWIGLQCSELWSSVACCRWVTVMKFLSHITLWTKSAEQMSQRIPPLSFSFLQKRGQLCQCPDDGPLWSVSLRCPQASGCHPTTVHRSLAACPPTPLEPSALAMVACLPACLSAWPQAGRIQPRMKDHPSECGFQIEAYSSHTCAEIIKRKRLFVSGHGFWDNFGSQKSIASG